MRLDHLTLLFSMPKVGRARSTPLAPKESDVLSQRHILTICITQRLTNLRRMEAFDSPNFGS